MPRQLHSAPAAAAITLVLCIACFSFIVFVLLPAVAATPGTHIIIAGSPGVHIRNITRGALLILTLGYLAGIMGWITVFAAHRDGMHRLTSLFTAEAGSPTTQFRDWQR